MDGDGRGMASPSRNPAVSRRQGKASRKSIRVSPARACAFAVVRRVFESGAYADRAFAAEARDLGPRDRGLAMQIAYGTVQRRETLDHLASRLLQGPLSDLDAAVLAALRLGLFQALFLDGVAPHAAVNESVELIKRTAPGGAGLLNAVLRRAVREGEAMLAGLDDSTPAGAAVLHSVPQWLAEKWWLELGAASARALLAHVNEPAEHAIRSNPLVSAVEEVRARLPVRSRRPSGLPEALVLEGPFDAHGSMLFRDGAIMPQSRGSMLVSRILAPRPGERVLDLCAAPGAKTTHLAALMEDRGIVLAVERHRGRARALEATCKRMRASCVQVQAVDATAISADGPFDRVLVDPPCSGLGTLQSRPDLRWRAAPAAIEELAKLQANVLNAAAEVTRRGGTIVYSVCTISSAEGEELVGGFLRSHPQFVADDLESQHPGLGHPLGGRSLQLLPHRDGTDGFFIARLRRE